MTEEKFNNQPQISALPDQVVVGMAYVPYQNPKEIYSAEQGMSCGTLFPCLNKPFKECVGDNSD